MDPPPKIKTVYPHFHKKTKAHHPTLEWWVATNNPRTDGYFELVLSLCSLVRSLLPGVGVVIAKWRGVNLPDFMPVG